MRHPRHHGPLGIALTAALAVGVAGCGSDGADGATASGSGSGSSSSSSSSSPEWDKDHALAEAKEAIDARDQHDVSNPLDEGDEFATARYVRLYNKELQKIKDQQVTPKGSITTTSVHLKELNPDAVGGPDLAVIACSTSTVRYYTPNGKDVTADPETGKPLPKKPQKNAHLVSLTTTDKGKTWRISDTQQLLGKKAQESPCDASK